MCYQNPFPLADLGPLDLGRKRKQEKVFAKRQSLPDGAVNMRPSDELHSKLSSDLNKYIDDRLEEKII